MRKYNLECIVLKSVLHKDADKVFTLYAKTRGKITAVAKGVRKVSSKRGGSLDTLNYVLVGIYENKDGFKYINEVDCKNSFQNLKNDLQNVKHGFYTVELVHRLVELEHENVEIFELLLKTLTLMNSGRVANGLVINFFEISLMKELGYALNFSKCAICGRTFNEDWQEFRLNFDLGGFVCNNCGARGLEISKTDALLLNKLSRGKFNGEEKVAKLTVGAQANAKIDPLLKLYIKNVLDGDVKSTSLMF